MRVGSKISSQGSLSCPQFCKLGIKPSEVLRRAVEEEVRRREVEKIKDSIKKLKPILDRISLDNVVSGIREDRETR